LKSETNVTGLVVTDPTQPDTLNLATTIAGLKNELVCDPSLLLTLTNAPYSLTIQDDLRGKFSNKFQVYQYLFTNYWPQCTHRIIAGMETNGHGHLREYLVAVKAAAVWLNPGAASEAAALAPMRHIRARKAPSARTASATSQGQSMGRAPLRSRGGRARVVLRLRGPAARRPAGLFLARRGVVE